MSVKVGVRVRPFNKRQQQLDSKLIIQMDNTTTSIIDSDGQKKTFNYDYSFWSHDGFEVDEEGYHRPSNDKYADQHQVYEQIGSSILDNAWEGYNCCLFAYGQTGSGKSYSMIGYGVNKGIIPLVCNQIFKKIKVTSDGSRSFEVKVSMLQIYNESVRDLLSKSKKQQLKICQHKTLGVYVEGLSKHSVDSYQRIQKKIDQGSNNRSIAATLMNESSSRSHTIVSINFVQKIQVSSEQTSVKYSVIHLVDLAGSECVGKTGAHTKDRLRETAKINQSLSTLGRVIQILAENCNKKQKQKIFVPYRDSKLTFILRSALGGNSQTAMICAISPADDNYEQTLSTLRYASRAKKIQNKAIVNESDVDKLIRQLRQENQMLKKMLEEASRNKEGINYQMISNFNEMNKNMVDLGVVDSREEESMLNDLEEDSNFNQFNQSTMNQSVSFSPFAKGVNQNLPYLTNISQDQLLSFRIKYSCDQLMIGNKQGNPKPDVVLASLGIQPNHAFISFDSQTNKVYLQVLDQSSSNYTYVNGAQISQKSKEELFHLDRIIFGTGCAFLLMFKGSPPRAQKPVLQDIDYQLAIAEIQTINPDRSGPNNIYLQKVIQIQEDDLRKKLVSQIQQEFQQSKKQNEGEMRKHIQEKEKEYRDRLKQMQVVKEAETARLKRQLEERQSQARNLDEERNRIKGEVDRYLEETKVSKLREEKGKEELQSTKLNLQRKMRQVQEMQHRMTELQAKTEQKKQQLRYELKRQQQDMKRQLQIQTIICHNQNIISQYKLQQTKRARHVNSVREYLVKKQRIQLMKQLTQLVPQVQKLNLIAKQMGKRVECGLSIEYRYISDAEIVESSKNNSYKSKLKITVHVINRDEGRSYYWAIDIFRNRFQHALQMWEEFIRQGKQFQYSKEADPYWDPELYQPVAYAHLTLQCLMFNLGFAGDIKIVKSGKAIGRMTIQIFPTDHKGTTNITIQDKGQNGTFKLISPHQQTEKTLYFVLEINFIEIIGGSIDFQSFKLEYEILQGLRVVRHQTEVVDRKQMAGFRFKKMHTVRQVSEATVMHFMEKPVIIQFQVVQKVNCEDQLTHRSSFSVSTNPKGSFAMQMQGQGVQINQFQDISPPKNGQLSPPTMASSQKTYSTYTATSPTRKVNSGVIYQNTDITSKYEQEYQRKKIEQERQKRSQQELHGSQVDMRKKKGQSVAGQTKKEKEKDCTIY